VFEFEVAKIKNLWVSVTKCQEEKGLGVQGLGKLEISEG
jgi:hypothetical protein